MLSNVSMFGNQGLRAASYGKGFLANDNTFDRLTENLYRLTAEFDGLDRSTKRIIDAYSDLDSLTSSRISSMTTEVELYGTLSIALASAAVLLGQMVSELEREAQYVETFTSGLLKFSKTEVIGKAFELARSSYLGVEHVLSAQRSLAQTGMNRQNVEIATTQLAKFATATGSGMEELTDLLIKLINLLNIKDSDIEQSLDYMTAAVNRTNLQTYQIAETFKYTAPILGLLNVSVKDAMGVIGALAQSGITGSLMGTSLRRILLQLATFPSELKKNSELSRLLKQLFPNGLTYMDKNGNIDILTAFETMSKNMSNVNDNIASVAKTLFGQRAVQSVLRLLDKEDGQLVISKYIDKISSGATGSTEKNLAQNLENASASFKLLATSAQQFLFNISKSITDAIALGASVMNLVSSYVAGGKDSEKNAQRNIDVAGKLTANAASFTVRHPFETMIGAYLTTRIMRLLAKTVSSSVSLYRTFTALSTAKKILSGFELLEPTAKKPSVGFSDSLFSAGSSQWIRQLLKENKYDIAKFGQKADVVLTPSDVSNLSKDEETKRAFTNYLLNPSSVSARKGLLDNLNKGVITNLIDRSVILNTILKELETMSSVLGSERLKALLRADTISHENNDRNPPASPGTIPENQRELYFKTIISNSDDFYVGKRTKEELKIIVDNYNKMLKNDNLEGDDLRLLNAKLVVGNILTLNNSKLAAREIMSLYGTTKSKIKDIYDDIRTKPKIYSDLDRTLKLSHLISEEQMAIIEDESGLFIDPGKFILPKGKETFGKALKPLVSIYDNGNTAGLAFVAKDKKNSYIDMLGINKKVFKSAVPEEIVGTKIKKWEDVDKELKEEYITSRKKFIEAVNKGDAKTYEEINQILKSTGFGKSFTKIVSAVTGIDEKKLLKSQMWRVSSGEPGANNIKVGDLTFGAFAGKLENVKNTSAIYGQVEKYLMAGDKKVQEIVEEELSNVKGGVGKEQLTRLNELLFGEKGLITNRQKILGNKSLTPNILTNGLTNYVKKLTDEKDNSELGNILKYVKKKLNVTDLNILTTIRKMALYSPEYTKVGGKYNKVVDELSEKVSSGTDIFKIAFHGTEDSETTFSGIESVFTKVHNEIAKYVGDLQLVVSTALDKLALEAELGNTSFFQKIGTAFKKMYRKITTPIAKFIDNHTKFQAIDAEAANIESKKYAEAYVELNKKKFRLKTRGEDDLASEYHTEYLTNLKSSLNYKYIARNDKDIERLKNISDISNTIKNRLLKSMELRGKYLTKILQAELKGERASNLTYSRLKRTEKNITRLTGAAGEPLTKLNLDVNRSYAARERLRVYIDNELPGQAAVSRFRNFISGGSMFTNIGLGLILTTLTMKISESIGQLTQGAKTQSNLSGLQQLIDVRGASIDYINSEMSNLQDIAARHGQTFDKDITAMYNKRFQEAKLEYDRAKATGSLKDVAALEERMRKLVETLFSDAIQLQLQKENGGILNTMISALPQFGMYASMLMPQVFGALPSLGIIGALAGIEVLVSHMKNNQEIAEQEERLKMEKEERRHREMMEELKQLNETRALFDVNAIRAQQNISITVNSSEDAQKELLKWRNYMLGTRQLGLSIIPEM